MFDVQESDRFKIELEEAVYWLYSHNLEQSEVFADRKLLELQQEVNKLKLNLQSNPNMGQADSISGIRRFPMYAGRFVTTWVVNEEEKVLTLLEFMDSKYPQELRQVYMLDDSEE